MNNRPILSILTPVYNGETYVSETIESVINSRIELAYEYLVLDDGSTDSTLGILNRYKGKVKIFSHKNIGESATINLGLEKAIGDFILVVNADDPLLTGELITQACKMLTEDPSIVAVYPDWKIINHNGKTIKTKIISDYSDELLIGRCRCLPGPGTVFRRSKALQIGGRNPKWSYVSDYDFWLRLSRVGVIKRLPYVMAQWRANAESTSVTQRNYKMAMERIKVITTFLSQNTVSQDLRRKSLGNSHYLAARLVFFDSNIDGRKLLLKAFRYRRGWPEEAKFYVVIYILLIPLSAIILKPFLRIIVKLFAYR